VTDLLTLERTSRVTPLGVRFVDDQSGRVVGDNLSVSAWPTPEPSRALPLRLNATNVYYLLDAPGLRDESFGAGDDDYWNNLARRRGFTVEVEDRSHRFLPFRFTVDLPHRGLLRLQCGSPLSNVPLPPDAESDGVPLFTAPARPTTPGSVVLRADLWDATNNVPAAWAMLEARTPGAAARGEPPVRALADYRGRVALHVPIPDESDFDGGSFDSPSGSTGAPLGARTWLVNLSAEYGRLQPAPDTLKRPEPPIADLCSALNQPPARLWDRLSGAPLQRTTVTLRMGQETLLKSSDPTFSPSVLLLTS
jgi:hypothetical protein